MADFSLSVAVVTLAHAIPHGVSAVENTKHGGALAALTPRTMRFSMNHRPEKFKHIGQYLRDKSKGKEAWTVESGLSVEYVPNQDNVKKYDELYQNYLKRRKKQ